MEIASTDDVENTARSAAVTKRLGGPLGMTDAAMNYYELEPGDEFAGAVHTHMNQEEIFYVMEGVATFETVDDEHTIGAGEAIRFAPGEYQQGRNESDSLVRALALGAPKDAGESRVRQACDVCGDSEYHLVRVDETGLTLECPECGNEIA